MFSHNKLECLYLSQLKAIEFKDTFGKKHSSLFCQRVNEDLKPRPKDKNFFLFVSDAVEK